MTSSGKTHTMMGSDEVPGIVPHAMAEVFRTIARTPGKEFMLRLSMMEIYNEVCGVEGWVVQEVCVWGEGGVMWVGGGGLS